MLRCVFLGYMWRIAEAMRRSPGCELVAVGIEPRRTRSPEVERWCAESGVRMFVANGVRRNLEFEAMLGAGVDLLVVGAFGQILSREHLTHVRYGTINFHPSRLPAYRGGSPLEEQLLQGETLGGITAHWVTEQVDKGPLIGVRDLPIGPDDDYSSLYERGHQVAGGLMEMLLRSHPSEWPRLDTDADSPVYAPKTASDGVIDWSDTAEHIDRLVRALGWRGWVRADRAGGTTLTIERSRVERDNLANWIPGLVVEAGDHPLIGTREGLLRLVRFRTEGLLNAGEILLARVRVSEPVDEER